MLSEKDQNREETTNVDMYANRSLVDESLFQSKSGGKVNHFVKKCNESVQSGLSEEELILEVIKNALSIEFSSEFGNNKNIVDTIKEAMATDTMLKKDTVEFAKKQFKQVTLENIEYH